LCRLGPARTDGYDRHQQTRRRTHRRNAARGYRPRRGQGRTPRPRHLAREPRHKPGDLPRLAPHRGGRGQGGDRRCPAREVHQHRCDARRDRPLSRPGVVGRPADQRSALRTGLRWVLALAFGYAGYRHLATPAPFLAITPPWVPDPLLVVAATGIAEICGAIGLMVPATRTIAGWALALYALCVWPA